MKKDISELPPDVQEQIRALENLPDDQIDTTDAPEILDWSDTRRGVFYRPVKQQITLRIDADIIAWFKAQAPTVAVTRRISMERCENMCRGRRVRRNVLEGRGLCDRGSRRRYRGGRGLRGVRGIHAI